MTPRDFCYWLQGFFELTWGRTVGEPTPLTLTTEQVSAIMEHLQLVFKSEVKSGPLNFRSFTVTPDELGCGQPTVLWGNPDGTPPGSC